MEDSLIELKKYVDKYLNGNLSKEEFGKWAEHAYFDLLRGGFVVIKKLVIYPFLKTVSRVNIECDDMKEVYPCSKDDVKKVQEILHGEKNFDFQIEIAVPIQLEKMFGENFFFNQSKREIFSKLREVLLSYLKNETQDFTEIVNSFEQLSEIECKEDGETILECLEATIIKMYRTMFDMDEVYLVRKQRLGLYSGGMVKNLGMQKLIDYLDCYMGEKSFLVLVSYREGSPKVEIIV